MNIIKKAIGRRRGPWAGLLAAAALLPALLCAGVQARDLTPPQVRSAREERDPDFRVTAGNQDLQASIRRLGHYIMSFCVYVV